MEMIRLDIHSDIPVSYILQVNLMVEPHEGFNDVASVNVRKGNVLRIVHQRLNQGVPISWTCQNMDSTWWITRSRYSPTMMNRLMEPIVRQMNQDIVNEHITIRYLITMPLNI